MQWEFKYQVKSIADEIKERMQQADMSWAMRRVTGKKWILLDYRDGCARIPFPEREFYNLKSCGDAKVLAFDPLLLTPLQKCHKYL